MKKTINSLFVFVLLFLFVGCTKSDSRVRYVFLDETGKEHSGRCKLAPDKESVQLPTVMLYHSGIITTYVTNGQKWIEGEYDHGKPNGVIKMWGKDGSLFIEENYKNGLKHGKLIWWHPNGVKNMEIDYSNDKKNGLWVEWDESGNETLRRHFKNDNLIK